MGMARGWVPRGCSGVPSWGHPAGDGDVPRVLCGHEETCRGGSSPLGALLLCPASSPWEDPKHCVSTCFSWESLQKPSNPAFPRKHRATSHRASPFSREHLLPWSLAQPPWCPHHSPLGLPCSHLDPRHPQPPWTPRWGHQPWVSPGSAPSRRAELFCLHTTLPPCLPLFPPFPLLAKRAGKGRDFNLLPGTN